MTIDELIYSHEHRVALQFSGGRDSLALLLLLREHLHRVTVYYTNSGDAYPETLELVEAVKSIVPRFVEIKGDSPAVREQFGWPSDVLQAGAEWMFPQNITDHLRLQDRHRCCLRSIMVPMHERMRADGITLILRGQRDEDTTKSHVKSGEVVDGFQIVYPINDWSTHQVEDFIRSCGVPVPPYYAEGLTSAPDCMTCTAWLEHGAVPYIKKHHPEQHAEVNRRLRQIAVKVQSNFDRLQEALR